MSKYLKFISILNILSFLAGIILIALSIPSLKGFTLVGGIIGLIICLIIGPADAVIFWQVGNLLERTSDLEEKVMLNQRLMIDGSATFSVFKTFEILDEFDIKDGNGSLPLVAGLSGVVTEEDEYDVKGILYLENKKIEVMLPNDNQKVLVLEFAKVHNDIKTPNGFTINKDKVGLVKKHFENGDISAELEVDNSLKYEIVIQKSQIIPEEDK